MVDRLYDAVVAGAGPAGGHLSGLLAARGLRVLLLDRLPDLSANAFSSAGTVNACLERYALPPATVGATWRGMEVRGSRSEARWLGDRAVGAVLDFGRLRRHLAEVAAGHGAEVLLGAQATGLRPGAARQTLELLCGGERIEVGARVLVDATGPARALMRHAAPPAPAYLQGVGLEWLVEVPAEVWEPWSETLGFFLGSAWMPQGYAWIFPMERGLLKVGAGRYARDAAAGPPALRPRIEALLREVLGSPPARLVDAHGGVLRYARGLRDPYAAGSLIAVGDAVSTLNPLGGEGIRHALEGAGIALPFILSELESPGRGFPGYARAMHRRFARAWHWSEELADRRYLEDADPRIDRMVRFLAGQDLDFVVAVLFGYDFARAARAAGSAWLWSRLARFGRRLGGGR